MMKTSRLCCIVGLALGSAACTGEMLDYAGGSYQAVLAADEMEMTESVAAETTPLAEVSRLAAIDRGIESLADRLAPIPIDNIPRGETPILRDEAERRGMYGFQSSRFPDPDEEDDGLDSRSIGADIDRIELSPTVPEHTVTGSRVPGELLSSVVVAMVQIDPWWFADDDADCLINIGEIVYGTSPWDPDSDDDGWFDGACNQRRQLYLERITAHDEQEDVGEDETYLVVDDVRYPNRERDLDDWWDLDDGDTHWDNLLLAERVRGTNTWSSFANVVIEGWEDDWEVWNTWTVDDLLFYFGVDMGAWSNGQTFTVRKSYDDWDYELRFRMNIQYFADPNPLDPYADSDADGIAEIAEFAVARDFGGITDPQRKDVLVELDWMSGHSFNTESKRMVTTQYHRYGYDLVIFRHQTLPFDSCLTATEARQLYNSHFSFKGYGAFRYAAFTEELWNDASGVALGDTFFTDDSTWWISGDELAQAGTFIHELGHTMSLIQSGTYYQIDTIGDVTYDSVMNYLYQAVMVDYSYDDTSGFWGGDHDDWEDVDPTYGLQYSFGNTTWTYDGHCGG